jgi:hypothetical protein
MSIKKILGQQMLAYNNKSLTDMMVLFDDHIIISDFNTGATLINGISECENMYAELFKNSPNLHADLLSAIYFENKMIVHENIYGRNGTAEVTEQVIIFEVTQGKINKISLIRE